MSYPSGPPGGYPGQPPQQGTPVFGQPPARPNPLGRLGIPGLLVLGTFVLALVAYFCSYGGGYGIEVIILLGGGLLAGLSLLPNAPALLPYAAVLSVIGGLSELDAVINVSGGRIPTAVILILVFGLLQAVAAVTAVLLSYGLIKLAPKAAVPHAAVGYPPSGGFLGQQQHQQPQQQQPQQQPQQQQRAPHQQQQPGQPQPGQPQQPQATAYLPSTPPTPQSTQFLGHPGQLNQPYNQPGGNGPEDRDPFG
jgi:hypothetical protein